jgi:hypothetical protein
MGRECFSNSHLNLIRVRKHGKRKTQASSALALQHIFYEYILRDKSSKRFYHGGPGIRVIEELAN